MEPLIFSPQAWADIQYLLHKCPGEVSFFCVARNPEQLNYIDEIFIPEQEVSVASAEPTAEGHVKMAAFFDEQGVLPDQYLRIWGHTHPPGVHAPSSTDWTTFKEMFCDTPFGVMLILAKDGWVGAWYTSPGGPLAPPAGSKESARPVEILIDWVPDKDERLDGIIASNVRTARPTLTHYTAQNSHAIDYEDWEAEWSRRSSGAAASGRNYASSDPWDASNTDVPLDLEDWWLGDWVTDTKESEIREEIIETLQLIRDVTDEELQDPAVFDFHVDVYSALQAKHGADLSECFPRTCPNARAVISKVQEAIEARFQSLALQMDSTCTETLDSNLVSQPR